MNPALPVMNRLKIAAPCDADWDEMRGDDKSRHCALCDKFVYNLPLLEPDELVSLIERTEGQFCGRLYARRDGTVLTDDCPVGAARKMARARRRGVAAAAVLAGLVAAAGAGIYSAAWGGCDVGPGPIAGEIEIVEPVEIPDMPEEPMMGAIAIDPDSLE